MKHIIVTYHKNCIDGFAGAWAAWKEFGNKAEYIPVRPGTLPEKQLRGKIIYSIDVSYPKAVQEKLRRKNKSVVILDHHVSRKMDTEVFPEDVFNNDHSGAVLAWRYFHPEKKVPRLLKYVEENDLWHFHSAHSKEIGRALTLLGFDFAEWDVFSRKFETRGEFQKTAAQGATILEYEKQAIEFVMRRSTFLVRFCGYKVLAANSPVFESDLGHALAKKRPPFGIVWRMESNGDIGVSLRSNGKVDVSKVAAKYGGGGHKKAAGFEVKKGKKVPWKVIR